MSLTNPSEIDQTQLLTLKFPDLGSNDIIVPGTANHSFNIVLKADPNRTLVSNIGRAIVKKIKKLAIKFDENLILEVDNFDVFACYRDLWKTKSEKRDAMRQGIISDDSCTVNCIKLRMNAKDKSTSNTQDNAIVNAYRNKFIIPLDFKMLYSVIPYYQSGLRNKLCNEITFNEYGKVICAAGQTPTSDAMCEIKNISLEYEIVTQLDLARNKFQKNGVIVRQSC